MKILKLPRIEATTPEERDEAKAQVLEFVKLAHSRFSNQGISHIALIEMQDGLIRLAAGRTLENLEEYLEVLKTQEHVERYEIERLENIH